MEISKKACAGLLQWPEKRPLINAAPDINKTVIDDLYLGLLASESTLASITTARMVSTSSIVTN